MTMGENPTSHITEKEDPSFERLLKEVNGPRIFAALFPYFAYIREGSTELEHGTNFVKLEIAAHHLILSPNQIDKEIFPEHLNYALDALRTEFNGFLPPLHEINNETKLDHITNKVALDSKIIRGSAYPFQTEEKILGIQGRFDKFFEDEVGLTPTKALELFSSILKISEEKVQTFRERMKAFADVFLEEWKKNPIEYISTADEAIVYGCSVYQVQEAYRELPVSFEEIKTVNFTLVEKEWQSFLAMFALGTGSHGSDLAFEEIKKFPVAKIGEEGVLMWDLSNAFDQVFNRFESLIKTNQKQYQKYSKIKGEWLERQAVSKLGKIFPSECIFRTVDYPDPDNPRSTAEVDIVVVWEPFLLFFEAKSGSFRFESQVGDANRLRTDLKRNLEDAFIQAKRASRYFLSESDPKFTQRSTGKKLPIVKKRIKKIILSTVTLDRFGQLASQLTSLAPMGLFADEEYPWSIPLADLNVVVDFAKYGDVLLHYISKRLTLQNLDTYFQSDELDFLGAYLLNRLDIEKFKHNGKLPNFVTLTGLSDFFDSFYTACESGTQEPKQITLPKNIEKILIELRSRKSDCEARYLAFYLLDIPEGELQTIDSALDQIWTSTPKPGQFKRCTLNVKGTTVSLLASKDLPEKYIEAQTRLRAKIEKYRYKTMKSICFGIDLSQPSKIFHAFHYIEGDWKFDVSLDLALKEEPSVKLSKKQLPGRNQQCLCGSGKKFKRCCINQYK